VYAFTITIRFEKPPETLVRSWREGMKEAHYAQGLHWHTEILPKHFEPGSESNYHHKPRQAKYKKYKRMAAQGNGPYKKRGPIALGGIVDNVFTGFLMRMMLNLAVIKPYPSRVTVRMAGPRYISMRPYKSNHPDKARELTEVTDRERAQLNDVLRREVLKRFRLAKETPITISIP
jgi:hypothetical protein